MLRYVLRRLAWMVPTFLGITLLVFVAVRAAPGDPADLVAGDVESAQAGSASSEQRERFRAEHLLDRPILVQYLHFLGPFDLGEDGPTWLGGSGRDPWHGVLALDFGFEFQRPSVPVSAELFRRVAVTLPLALASILLAWAIAIPLGILSATRRGSLADKVASLALFGLHSVPTFWAGLMLILLFGAAGLGWLPVLGLHDQDAADLGPIAYALDTLRHAILPVATLAFASLAYLSRQMRGAMVEAMESDHVRAARAKGLPERDVIRRHALRTALLPLITLSGSILPALIGGSVVVETVFGIPGMGRYAYEGLLARDYNVILATTTLAAATTLVGILLADVAYALADPRIRYE